MALSTRTCLSAETGRSAEDLPVKNADLPVKKIVHADLPVRVACATVDAEAGNSSD